MAILAIPALCPAHPFFPKIAPRIDILYESIPHITPNSYDYYFSFLRGFDICFTIVTFLFGSGRP